MIRSFKCSETRELFERGKSSRFSAIERIATRKLAMLNAAESLEFLRWTSQGPEDVEIVNYHWGAAMSTRHGMRPVHPGEILLEEFMKPLGLSANALAKALAVPAPRVNDIVRERRGVSADTALRLARYFGGDARSWLNLQTAHDLRVAEIKSGRRIAMEIKPAPAQQS